METERLAEMLDCLSSEAVLVAAAISAPQIQIVRACIIDWDEVGDDGTQIDGGRDALDYDPQRNRKIIRDILWRIARGTGVTLTIGGVFGGSGSSGGGFFTTVSPFDHYHG
jgi:hypothetical protein